MTPLAQFLNAMLAADVALQVHGTDTAASRAYRALLHLTTEAGSLAMEGRGPSAEWRGRVMQVLAVLCEGPSPFLPAAGGATAPVGHPAASCDFSRESIIDNCTH